MKKKKQKDTTRIIVGTLDSLNAPQRYCKACKHYDSRIERCMVRNEHVERKNYCNFWEN